MRLPRLLSALSELLHWLLLGSRNKSESTVSLLILVVWLAQAPHRVGSNPVVEAIVVPSAGNALAIELEPTPGGLC